MTMEKAVQKHILDLCRKRKLTVNGLANLCSFTQSTIDSIVSGKTRTTTISTLQKICDGLGITILDFFNDPLFENLEPEVK